MAPQPAPLARSGRCGLCSVRMRQLVLWFTRPAPPARSRGALPPLSHAAPLAACAQPATGAAASPHLRARRGAPRPSPGPRHGLRGAVAFACHRGGCGGRFQARSHNRAQACKQASYFSSIDVSMRYVQLAIDNSAQACRLEVATVHRPSTAGAEQDCKICATAHARPRTRSLVQTLSNSFKLSNFERQGATVCFTL